MTDKKGEIVAAAQREDAARREGLASIGEAERSADAVSTEGVKRIDDLGGRRQRISAFRES